MFRTTELCLYLSFFFFKQKTAYEMRISDWSSDVCSSDLFIRKVQKGRMTRPMTRVVVCVPYGSTQVERRAIRESVENAGARKAVRAAVEMAQPAGWTRVFIDEGEVIASLINEICAGGPSMDSASHAFVSRLASLMRHGLVMETEDDGEYGLGSRLARREVDILSMVSGGLRNREIGDRLGLTEGTVKWYMQQIYDKLGVRRRPQAVIRARQLGILH